MFGEANVHVKKTNVTHSLATFSFKSELKGHYAVGGAAGGAIGRAAAAT